MNCTNNTVYSGSSLGPNPGNGPFPNPQNENNKKSRSEYWKSLIDELKNYGYIKSAIKKQQENHDKLQKEIDEWGKQKQEISVQCQNGIYFINEINNKISFFKGLMDHYNNNTNNKSNLSSKFSTALPVFIIYYNTGKEDKENRNK